MTGADAVFSGAIPEVYDRYLGPCLFEPFAEEMAARFLGFDGALLETAAGTGRVTRRLAEAVGPSAAITATDLNEAMLQQAALRVTAPNVRFQAADAQALPFGDAAFGAVVCQFGVMFYPDKAVGYAEARRVLAPGGVYVFNVWSDLEANTLSEALQLAVADLFPGDPPSFVRRIPFGYHDRDAIRAALQAAGFDTVEVDVVSRRVVVSASGFARGMCMGSPLRAEIEARAPGDLRAVTEAVARQIERRFGTGEIDSAGEALVFAAR
jgi:ubiquinone/menaquinone biosynthesis C-methylase UbiE